MGEKEAMAQLLRRRQKWLYNVARKTISNESLIEDGLQEALVQIWKGANSFRGDSQVTTWMHQIVVRACIDILRKEKLRSHAPLPDGADQLIPSTVRFENQLVDTMLIHGALQELEPNQSQILRLIWLEEMSYEEVAQMLNLPLGTVKSRASRSQSRLKMVLQEILSEDGTNSSAHTSNGQG